MQLIFFVGSFSSILFLLFLEKASILKLILSLAILVVGTHKICVPFFKVSYKCYHDRNIFLKPVLQSILFSKFIHFDMKIKFTHFNCFALYGFIIYVIHLLPCCWCSVTKCPNL